MPHRDVYAGTGPELTQLHLGRTTLCLAIRVDVRVRQDPIQPRLEIRALRVGVIGPIHLEERLLHSTLCIGRVSRHAQRRRIELGRVLHRIPPEVRLIRHGAPCSSASTPMRSCIRLCNRPPPRPAPAGVYAQAVISYVPSAMPIADPSPVIEREWIVTNGIGRYSSGTIAGVLTRRYHGLLVAGLDPPLGRTVLVAKLDDSISFGEDPVPLFTNQWGDAQTPVAPDGFRHLTRFHLEGKTPVCRRRGRSTRTWRYRSVPGRSELERPRSVLRVLLRRHRGWTWRQPPDGLTGLVATLPQDQGEEQ